ncbi:MAG: D-alanine--D-alanine ligase [Patescibacteria group bacterium]|nr:D-alanine--D-alanine ligase [Patescibacteria group bacterium]
MKTIAVIFGGKSTEHDVSIITALASVIKPLELTKQFRVEAIYIAKDGSWYWDDRLKDISLYRSDEINDFVQKAPKVHLLFDEGLTLVKSSQFAGRKQYKRIDVVFPAMHGTHGEDGELMGVLQMASVPYVGCDMASSAVAMDKVLSKLIAQSQGLATPKFVHFKRSEYSRNMTETLERINKELTYPLFVKPAHLGSSIGITKVKTKDELNNAIEVALHYDDKALVEESVENLVEVTLPIMGNEEPIPALLEQPLLKSDEFFDFDTKYMQGGKKGGGKKGGSESGAQGYSKIPADLPKDLYDKAVELGLSVYKAVGCEGFARIDMLINGKTKELFFNEINPMPGSLYSHNWNKAGVSNVQLVTKLVEYAEARFRDQQKMATAFTTNYLKQF